MKAKIYIGAKKYALYIGRKIVGKTLEFLTLPARFISNKSQELKNFTVFGNSVQEETPDTDKPVFVKSVGNLKNIFNKNGYLNDWYSTGSQTIYNNSANKTAMIRHIPGTKYYFKHCNVTGGGRAFYTTVESPQIGDPCSKMTGSVSIAPNEVISYTNVPDNATWVFFILSRNNFDVSVKAQLDDFIISTEPIDADTPYQPYGKCDIPIEISGQNLFDVNNPWRHGYFNENGVWYGSSSFNALLAECKPNTEYTLTYEARGTSANGKRLHALDKDMNWIVQLDHTAASTTDRNVTKTTPSNAKYLTFTYSNTVAKITNLQLEEGTEATEYQPYLQSINETITLDEPLRKIDEYADTLSIEGTNVVVTRNVEVIDDTGTLPIEECLRQKIPATTETYTIDQPIQLEQGTILANIDTKIRPSKISITGDIDNE